MMSAIILEIQYAGKDIPDTSYICFNASIRSFKRNEIIATGSIDKATPTMNEKSTWFPSFFLSSKTEETGKLTVVKL